MNARLDAYLRAVRSRPFRFGRHDCVLFAARWVRLATGREALLGIRYTSRRRGLAALAERGFADPVAAAAAQLAEVPVLQARPGDLAVIPDEAWGALGIVTGERVAVLTRAGLGSVSLTMARRAFRVI